MEKATELFETMLRRHGLFVTAARLHVFETLWKNGPLTMNELEQLLDSKINRTSIYRIVDVFIDLGIAHKIPVGWKYKVELSDVFVDHHHHIACTKCGKLYALPEQASLERLIQQVIKTTDFVDVSHQLEMRGVCLECQEQSRNDDKS